MKSMSRECWPGILTNVNTRITMISTIILSLVPIRCGDRAARRTVGDSKYTAEVVGSVLSCILNLRRSDGPHSLQRMGTRLDHSGFNMSSTFYPLASLSQIEKSPSREDGLPEELEEDLRAYGCKLIHQAGLLLKQ